MHLIYLDESGDYRWFNGCTQHFVLSALVVPDHSFAEAFGRVKQFRRAIKESDGMLLRKEIHAREFVKGKGQLGPTTISKGRRCAIYKDLLTLLNSLAELGVYTINCSIPNAPGQDRYELAVDRVLNRLNRTLQYFDTYGILVFDEGKERLVRKITRRMHVHNPIPSALGAWETGEYTKNLTIDRIVGDPFFKSSAEDYFLQAVDCIAFGLLKQDEPPTPHVTTYGLNTAFAQLNDLYWRPARPRDPQGVVRE